MKIVEIFRSIEGEGIRAGYPATFVRFYGCNLNCSYCDSLYANKGGGYEEMNVVEIINAVENLGCKRVTVTGGEPLMVPEIYSFLNSLSRRGYEVNVETNGSIPIQLKRIPGVFFTMDYKSLSSGMNDKMSHDNIESLVDSSWESLPNVLKFVVGDESDLLDMYYIITGYNKLYKYVKIFVSPVFGKIEPKDIVEFMSRKGVEGAFQKVRLQVQLHKIVWNPNMRGV